jgi:hypothetical protein
MQSLKPQARVMLMVKSVRSVATREVFLPARILDLCLEDWDNAADEELGQAVGEAMEHAYTHLHWLLAIRRHRCRLVVVQLRDAQGTDMNPHYQLGDLFTLSGWHPERALEEARELLADSGDGLTFDLPVNDDMLQDWYELAEDLELEPPADASDDAPSAIELLAAAMMLLDAAHEEYAAELGDGFYIATRGTASSLQALEHDPFGHWSAETMQVLETPASIGMAQLFPNPPEELSGKVPHVLQPTRVPEEEDDHAH